MKILISTDGPAAHHFIRLGIARALTAAGHEVVLWDLRAKPPNDALDEFEPQILWSQTYNLTRSFTNAILERPWLQVCLRSSDWGPLSEEIDKEKYPILTANQREIGFVRQLQDAGNLGFIHAHYMPYRLDGTHGNWRSAGIKVVSMLHAADTFDYCSGKEKPEFSCDVCFIGGYWGYKARTLEKYIIPLREHLKIKVFGNQPWGIPEYCGSLPTEEARHALKSAKVAVNVSEPHSQDFGWDIIERPYKLLSNRCLVVSDYVVDMEILFGDSIIFGRSPEEFQGEVMNLCLDKDAREKEMYRADLGHDLVMNNHTYFHRAADMFINLEMPDEARHILEVYADIQEKF